MAGRPKHIRRVDGLCKESHKNGYAHVGDGTPDRLIPRPRTLYCALCSLCCIYVHTSFSKRVLGITTGLLVVSGVSSYRVSTRGRNAKRRTKLETNVGWQNSENFRLFARRTTAYSCPRQPPPHLHQAERPVGSRGGRRLRRSQQARGRVLASKKKRNERQEKKNAPNRRVDASLFDRRLATLLI